MSFWTADNISYALQAPARRVGTDKTFSHISIDTRTLQPQAVYVAIQGKRLDGHAFIKQAIAQGATGVVVAHDQDIPESADISVWVVPDTTQAFADLANYLRLTLDIPCVGITGSSGKTTTKSMLAHVLQDQQVCSTYANENNRIGVPLTLHKLNESHDVAVLEIGTNEWGEIALSTRCAKPNIGVMTNIGPAHLETFGDLAGVVKAKSELWQNMSEDATLILNADDPNLVEMSQKCPQQIVWFGIENQADVMATEVILSAQSSQWQYQGQSVQLNLPGKHSIYNALAVLACVQQLGFSVEAAIAHLRNFEGVGGRLDITSIGEGWLIDDTYNANPASFEAGVDVLMRVSPDGRKIVILGDMLELGDQAEDWHARAGKYATRQSVDVLVTIGSLAREAARAALDAGMLEDEVHSFSTVDDAASFLQDALIPTDAVLIKGSRAMRMEQLKACFSTSSTH